MVKHELLIYSREIAFRQAEERARKFEEESQRRIREQKKELAAKEAVTNVVPPTSLVPNCRLDVR